MVDVQRKHCRGLNGATLADGQRIMGFMLDARQPTLFGLPRGLIHVHGLASASGPLGAGLWTSVQTCKRATSSR